MGSVSGLGSLPAVAFVAVKNRPCARSGQTEVDADAPVVARRHQAVRAALERCRPPVVPDVQRLRVRPGPSHAGPVQPFRHVVLPARNVGDGEMRHVEIADRPARRVDRAAIDACPKERHLVPEAAPPGHLQVPRVVPPLDAMVGVGCVIAREDEHVTRVGAQPGVILGVGLDPGRAAGRELSGGRRPGGQAECGGERDRGRECQRCPVTRGPARAYASGRHASGRHASELCHVVTARRTGRRTRSAPRGEPDRAPQAPPRPRRPPSPAPGSRPGGGTESSTRSSAR